MRFSLASAAFFISLVLAGCSAVPVQTTNSGALQGATISGRVHGGQNPIQGAHVYLLAVNSSATSTYAGPGLLPTTTNAATSLLTSGAGQDSLGFYVTTDSNGDFSITGDYTCPSPYARPYLLSLGGYPGSGTSNSAISLVGVLSTCSTPQFVIINEVSTVAAVYAFAGVTTDPTHVSTSNTTLAATALGNATTTVANLMNPSTSVANATSSGGNGTVPQAEINTLANILAACVNSTGSSSTQCTTLFANSPTTGASPANPTDTATAMVNIAHNPGANVANLYGILQGTAQPFAPALTSAPNDFTIAISYTATPALNSPTGLAIDGSGDVWVANNGNNSLTEFGPYGAYVQTVTTGGLKSPAEIAIDGSGNLWVSNLATGSNSISEFNSSGVANVNSPFTGGGLNGPEGLAVDAQGHLWAANFATGANSISEFNVSNGSPVSSSGITTGSFNLPNFIAVDDNGLVWITNSGNGTVTLWNPGFSTPYTGSPFSGGGLGVSRGVAIDSNNNAWIANRAGTVLSEFANTGAISSSGYSGGGINGSFGIAVDAANDSWVVNRGGGTISEFAPNGTAVSPSTGFYGAGSTTPILSNPGIVGIDLEGNVWVADTNNNRIVEYVGAATPLVTPIVANIITGHGYGDSAVNRP